MSGQGGSTIPASLTLDVFSDVVCPWCYLGKRRLERALSLVPEIDVTVRWRPFQLDSTIPQGGIERRVYLERKFGGPEAIAPTHRRMTEMGATEGIEYHFERIARSPNTLDAHRVIRWSATAGHEEATVERLFRAYFSEGLDIGDPSVLSRLAGEAGLDESVVASRLATDEDREAVEAEIAEAYRIGVTGVPCFVIASRYAVMGAQAPETIVRTLRSVAEELTGAGAAAAG
jgi:predicted DsbA family dithiol-disulfide isomerase